MDCMRPMKTANLNLIQYIIFFLAKTTTKAMILFFAEVITLCNFVRTHIKQAVSRPAAKVTGYLLLEINYGNHRLMSMPSIKLNKP